MQIPSRQSLTTETAFAPALAWRAAGAAVTGVSHRRAGLPCQDAQGYRLLPDGMLFVALADGAGSARYSDSGAAAAVDAALLALVDAWEREPREAEISPQRLEQLLREAFTVAREAVLALVEFENAGQLEGNSSARDYACTLTCAAAAPECVAVGQVGDGAVIALLGPDELAAVTRLQRGEYANETHFLTENDALDQLAIEVLDRPVSGLAVMSDGLIRLALRMPSQEPHRPFFQPLFRFAESIQDTQEASSQLAAFLDSERVNDRTDDDKSLVLAVRAPEALDLSKSRNGKHTATSSITAQHEEDA